MGKLCDSLGVCGETSVPEQTLGEVGRAGTEGEMRLIWANDSSPFLLDIELGRRITTDWNIVTGAEPPTAPGRLCSGSSRSGPGYGLWSSVSCVSTVTHRTSKRKRLKPFCSRRSCYALIGLCTLIGLCMDLYCSFQSAASSIQVQGLGSRFEAETVVQCNNRSSCLVRRSR